MFSSVASVNPDSVSCRSKLRSEEEEDEFGLASFPVSLLLLFHPGREVGPRREDEKCSLGGLGVARERGCGRGTGSGACNGVERVVERFGLWIVGHAVTVSGR
jgi:hypothetical protein